MLRPLSNIKSSLDKTRKFLYENEFSQILEVSHIDKDDGKDIICAPTQSGCTQGCLFCHMTGSGVDAIGLSPKDMVDGVLGVYYDLDLWTNTKPLLVSFMGCGEPLCNSVNLAQALVSLRQAVPYSRFALATILPKGSEEDFIKLGRFVKDHGINLKIHLSLHFTDDTLRLKWMPYAGLIMPSLDLLRWYHNFTGNNVEIHYTPIQGVNDTDTDVLKLKEMVGEYIPIKLLQFNPKPGLKSVPSDKVDSMCNRMDTYDMTYETYTPPGRDIGASCGQFDLSYYQRQSHDHRSPRI